MLIIKLIEVPSVPIADPVIEVPEFVHAILVTPETPVRGLTVLIVAIIMEFV